MANSAGYPTGSIETCGKFKRTHNFIMESFEALYRVMLEQFFESRDPVTSKCKFTSEEVESLITQSLLSVDHENFPTSFNQCLQSVQERLSGLFLDFQNFIQEKARQDETWRFWIQYVFQDVTTYAGLYFAMRSGKWQLRMSCIKQMGPVFQAFNHHTYSKLISNHIADVLCMNPTVLAMLQQGAFVVNISGRSWHSVAIDEAHEMLINRHQLVDHLQTSLIAQHIISPTEQKLKKTY